MSKRYHLVYITTLKDSGKFYVGKHSTKDTEDGYKGSGRWVDSVAKKSDLESMPVCIMNSEKSAYRFEEFLVGCMQRQNAKDCMNFSEGGKGFKSNRFVPHEVRKKISEKHKGKKLSQEQKDKIRNSTLGRIQNQLTRERIANKKKAWIVCLDTGMVFWGLTEAAKFFGVCNQQMHRLCTGQRKNPKINVEFME